MRANLELADQNFDLKRRVVEMLDVTARLCVEGGEKVAYVKCMIEVGERRLLIGAPCRKRALPPA